MCLLEGVPGENRAEDLCVAPVVGSRMEIVHWVRVTNRDPDPLTVYDGQVLGQWESVEEWWRID